jgi:hypothetical protein
MPVAGSGQPAARPIGEGLILFCVQSAMNRRGEPRLNSDCADMSALWFGATCRVEESGVVPPHSTRIVAF